MLTAQELRDIEERRKELREFSQMMPEGGDADPAIEVMGLLADQAIDAINNLLADRKALVEALKQAEKWLEGWASAEKELAIIRSALQEDR